MTGTSDGYGIYIDNVYLQEIITTQNNTQNNTQSNT